MRLTLSKCYCVSNIVIGVVFYNYGLSWGNPNFMG
jgi:hypothetical protein